MEGNLLGINSGIYLKFFWNAKGSHTIEGSVGVILLAINSRIYLKVFWYAKGTQIRFI